MSIKSFSQWLPESEQGVERHRAQEPIKQGVEELFESNPELASIGTPEQYSQYLGTIFPDSKVKDIVYHGTRNQFAEFRKTNIAFLEKLNIKLNRGTYFSTNKEHANYFATVDSRREGMVISALLNLKNPYEPLWDHVLFNSKKYDGLINYNKKDQNFTIDEFAVFEPAQIHILGGKKDTEGFKKFVSEKRINNQVMESTLQNFRQFILEQEGLTLDEQSLNEPATEESGGYITPTHEELSQLYWFQALHRTLETLDQGARWDTGQLAMSHGTRRLTASHDRSYTFYPKRGTITYGGMKSAAGIPYDSLEAWNAALFLVYTRIVSRLLGLNSSARFKNAIIKKDGIAITQFFNNINDHLSRHGVDPRPESFLFSLLYDISSPEEAEVMRDLRRLGLL